MTQIKKFTWSGITVALAMFVALSMIVSTAQAANSVTTTGTTAVSLSTNLATGTGAYTAFGTNPVITATAAGDLPLNGTIAITAPAGFQFNPAQNAAPTIGGGGTLVIGAGVLSSNNSVITYTITTAASVANTLTFDAPLQVRPIFTNTVGGDVTVSGASGVTVSGTVQTLTVTARQLPYVFRWNATPSPATTTIAADGSQTISWLAGTDGATAAGFDVRDSGGATNWIANSAVTFTAGIGGFGAAGTQQVTINTNATGQLSQALVYRGTGTAGTDTLIASVNGQTTTFNVTLQTVSPAAGTPTTIAGTANRLAIAPTASALTPAYTSPNTTATVTFRVTDAAGTGVNGRQVILSTNVGRIATVGNCSATSGTSVVVTTSTVSSVAGRAQADVCAMAAGQVGDITVTGTDAALTSVTGTLALTSAGPAASVTTNWNNGVLTVTAVDANGRRVADGTGFQVTLPTNVGAVSPNADTASVNGQVQFAIALTQPTGNAVITIRDAVAGTIRVNTAVNVTASTTPPATGDGTFAEAPNFGTSGVADAVFQGGSLQQLIDAADGASATVIWVRDNDGNWRSYRIGGAAFLNAGFNTAFADGFASSKAVFLVQ